MTAAPSPSPTTIEMNVVQSRVFERLFGRAATSVTIGRFVVLGAAGAGGMGVVFVARDPELDRKVAIKLVGRGNASEQSQARLLAEAQTMARLSHPNIVAVHEVGTYAGSVYVAMEYIEGETLERWLARAERPSTSQILAAFLQAGEGLSAAHEAGIVHRDFKPTNAMIDRAGRVRVLDFGLAIEEGSTTATSSDGSTSDQEPRTIGGTPLYMAPEHARGAPATPRTDLYAYCIALWTALTGAHPFAREDIDETTRAMADGRIDAPPRARLAPWLRRVLQRGLAPDPDARWPTMAALLAAIHGARVRSRRRRALVFVGTIAALALAVLGARELDERRRTAACEREADEVVSSIWNETTKQALDEALVGTAVAYAAVTVGKATPWIDRQAEDLRTAREEACVAATVQRRWDADTFDRSTWCLEGRERELSALVDELTRADPQVVHTAVLSAASLGPTAACIDEDTLQRMSPPPVSDRTRVREILAQLAQAYALERAGHYEDGLAIAKAAIEPAADVGWPPLWAIVKHREAALLKRSGAFAESERAYTEAYFEAMRIGAWDVAEQSAAGLVWVVGAEQGRIAEGLMWDRHARVALAHAGDPSGLRDAQRLHVLAGVYDTNGDPLEARRIHEQVVAMRSAIDGPEHPFVGTDLAFIAVTYQATGEYDKAIETFERALAIEENALGPWSPHVGQTAHNLGATYLDAQKPERAAPLIERSLAIFRAIGAQVAIPTALLTLGNLRKRQGKRDEARASYEQALAMMEETRGPASFQVADPLHNLAALDIAEGHPEHARPRLERALANQEAAFGPDHPSAASTRSMLGLLLLDTGDATGALPMLESATAALVAAPGRQADEDATHFRLARALVATGGDRERALAEAKLARDDFIELGRAADLAELATWLAEQRLDLG